MDVSMNLGAISDLQKEIDQELKEVRGLLEGVNSCCEADIGEDDFLINCICTYGKVLKEGWTKLCNVYEGISGQILALLKRYSDTIEEKKKDIDGLKKSL